MRENIWKAHLPPNDWIRDLKTYSIENDWFGEAEHPEERALLKRAQPWGVRPHTGGSASKQRIGRERGGGLKCL